MNTEFKQFLMDNKEKYQGLTRERFAEVYAQAKESAKRIAEAMGLDTSSIESDTHDVRLDALVEDGTVVSMCDLFWQEQAIKDALFEFYITNEGVKHDNAN